MANNVRASINVPKDGTPVVLRFINERLQQGRPMRYEDETMAYDLVVWEPLDTDSPD